MQYLEAVQTTLHDIVIPNVQKTDKDAIFPREAIVSFGKSGILGLMSAKDIGGLGLGLKEAATVIETVAGACPSTAMVLMMHYAATAVIEKYGSLELRQEIAAGRHLSTLAWSEVSSRSHFWAPAGTAEKVGDGFVLNGDKTMVTSASQADSYIWSSKPAAGEGASSLWLVKKYQEGLSSPRAFDGLGLRGNDSAPMSARNMKLDADALLGLDGEGFDIMINTVLPVFCTLNASASVGIIDAALALAIHHVSGQKLEHIDSRLVDLPTIRAYLAKAQIQADMTRTLRNDTLAALTEGRADAMLRVLEVKASAAESALMVTDNCMRVCGGAAFRKDLGLEKLFRDARSASVMAPTSDVLFDFIGKAICNIPVFG